jgi:hypothetical protein
MATKEETPPTFNDVMNKAAKSALRGGIAGAAAMGANVACLMWMRTTVRRRRPARTQRLMFDLFPHNRQ